MLWAVIVLLKPILCIVIILSSTVSGFHFSNRLYKRKEILQLFISNLKDAQTRIRYESRNLCDIFSDKFSGFMFNNEQRFITQWSELLKLYDKTLTKSDINLLMTFAENLGKTDVDGEITHIQMYVELLHSRINDAQNSINSKSKLYRTFGVCVGLLISIMLL